MQKIARQLAVGDVLVASEHHRIPAPITVAHITRIGGYGGPLLEVIGPSENGSTLIHFDPHTLVTIAA